ncbi:MAG: response regulator [Chloroflexi bacterium]|nr:response regulator [Chloroflexota bacterium]
MTKRILYVEDNLNNVLLVQRLLVADGHKLLVAPDATVGLETAVTQQPDLILMDLNLPGEMNGLELTRQIKQNPQLQHIPIVALTAHDNVEVEAAALAAGCVNFLRKPADLRQIRQTLQTYLNGNGETAVSATVTPSYTYI